MPSRERRGPWRPILTGQARSQALAAVDAIAAELRRPARRGKYATLADGSAGFAVLHDYVAEARGRNADRDVADTLLARASDSVASVVMRPSLWQGFSGVAWAIEHIGKRRGDAGDDLAAPIDDALIDFLGRSPWRRDYDLIDGLVGFGVYALERLPRRAAVECLKRIVARLDETAKRGARGLTWFTRPDLLIDQQRKDCPKGFYNLGLAHGVPGVIALCGAIHAAGVERRKTRALLDGAVDWLEAQRLPRNEHSIFPAMVEPSKPPESTRTAWCYGDPGIAAALLVAARAVGERRWAKRAVEIALAAAARPPELTRVKDAGICHGAAGLAHIYNRMFQATGEAQLAKASRFWFAQTLAMRRPGKGFAGFKGWGPDRDGKLAWVSDSGFLTGATGIALTLLAAATPVEPAWDRLLLIS